MGSSDKAVTRAARPSVDARRVITALHATVGAALAEPGRQYVLAVSGGADSMTLLHAAAAVLPLDRLLVATFDHGTGPPATEATQLVVAAGKRLGIPVAVGRGTGVPQTEAAWRQARWEFLHQISARHHAPVVTAHTRDDQVETVFIRALRDAGPRGLAALYAASPVRRPFLEVTRSMVREYADICGITFVTDPSNADRRHLRNRVRLDLLPALEDASPGFCDTLLTLARQAAGWRAHMEQIAATFTVMPDATGSFVIPRPQLAGFSHGCLATLWPALAARAGVVLDWRGTDRLASFTIEGESGQSIQLSGGIDVSMRRDALVFRRRGSRG